MSSQSKNADKGGSGRFKAVQSPKQQQRTAPRFRPKSFAASRPAAGLCDWCQQPVPAGAVICPHCGRSLTPDQCSFCGARMSPAAKFCTHCGQSREGVACPVCGTLNARNFCRRCGAPVTPLGREAQAAAQADPAFRAVQDRAAELARLHTRIKELRQAPPQEASAPSLSEADRALLDRYADVLRAVGASVPAQPLAGTREQERRLPRYADTAVDLDALLDAYREKAAEMDDALARLVPPPDFTPEQQRDYYAARKVATVHTAYDMSGYQPTVWQCNYCGAYHENPSACVAPELGGRWVYVTPEQYVERSHSFIEASHTLRID